MIRLKGHKIVDVIEERDLGVRIVTFVTENAVFEYKEVDISGETFVTFREIEVVNG